MIILVNKENLQFNNQEGEFFFAVFSKEIESTFFVSLLSYTGNTCENYKKKSWKYFVLPVHSSKISIIVVLL